MDVNKPNLRRQIFGLKRNFSVAPDTSGSSRPKRVSDIKTHFDNRICISELKNRVAYLMQQVTEVQNENRHLKIVQDRHTAALQAYHNADNGIHRTIVRQMDEVQSLNSSLRQIRACRDNTASKLNATEDRLLNTDNSLQHLRSLSQDQNLLEKEELSQLLARVSSELKQRDKGIKDLERRARLNRAWFNFQLDSMKMNTQKSCSCPEQNLSQDSKDKAEEPQKQTWSASEYEEILTSTEILSSVESEMYEEEPEDEPEDEPGDEPEDEQEDEPEDEQEDEQQEEQEEEQLEEQEEEQLEDQEEEQLEEQEESLDTETEDSTNVSSSESPVASEPSPVFTEQQETEELVSEESLTTLTKTKHTYVFKQTVENLHKGIPTYRREYVQIQVGSLALGNGDCELPPKNPLPGKLTQEEASSIPLNTTATTKTVSHWVINQ